MIFKGESVNRKREVMFQLVSAADGRSPITGATLDWNLVPATSLKVRAPGGVLVNADFARIVEIGDGGWALQLTDDQVALAGAGLLVVDASIGVAIPVQYEFEVVDPADFATSSGGGAGGGVLLPAGAVTLSGLIDTVRTRGDYLSSLTFTDAYVTKEIQAAWRELYELIANTHEGWWDKDSNVDTIAGQLYIGLPADCWRVQGVDILDGGEWRKLTQIGLSGRNRYGAASGQPEAYRLNVQGILLFPPPAKVYTLRVSYTPIIPALDDTGVQLYGWEDFVIEGTLLRLDEREERDISVRWRRLYDPENGLKAQIIRAASERRSAEPEALPIREMLDPWDLGVW